MRKNSVRILLSMLMVNIFRLSPRQNRKQLNSNKCWLQERPLLIKRFKWSKRNLQDSLPCPLSQLSKRKMMVMLRPLRKLKLRWRPLKQLWMQDFSRLIKEYNKCLKKQLQCQILELSPTFTALYLTWVK